MDKKIEQGLMELYEDLGFPSVAKFAKHKKFLKFQKEVGVKVTQKELKAFVQDQEEFQVFKQREIKKKRLLSHIRLQTGCMANGYCLPTRIQKP